VTARFVVDTAGRVESQSITVDSTANALFAASVREALRRARFHPALARGRPVRVTMLQEFVFRMERGGESGNGNKSG
jgi:TonB family protein